MKCLALTEDNVSINLKAVMLVELRSELKCARHSNGKQQSTGRGDVGNRNGSLRRERSMKRYKMASEVHSIKLGCNLALVIP